MGIPRRVIAFFLHRTRYFAGSLRRAPLAFLLLAASLGATWFSWQYSKELVDRLAYSKFNDEMKQIESGIVSAIGICAHELYGARGFFAGSENVTRDEWIRYTQRESADFLPGVVAIGYAERVSEDEKAAFVESVRSDTSVRPEGYAGFVIHPRRSGEALAVKYVAPEEPNVDQLGLDLWAESERAEALRTAIDSGRAAATAAFPYPRRDIPATLFEIYLPVYRRGAGPATQAGRESALQGAVFIQIDVDELMRGVYHDRAGAAAMDVEIYDGEILAAANLIHDRIPGGADLGLGERRRFSSDAMLSVIQRVWSVRYSSGGEGSALEDIVPIIVLMTGCGLSVLLFGVLYSLAASRATALQLAELAALVESSDDAILGISLGGVILSWNPAARRIYGYTADEMIGRPLSSLAPPGNASDAAQILERLGREGRIPYYETQRVAKDGSLILVSSTVSPIRDVDGKIKGISTIDRDITRLTEVQRRLEQSKDFYLTLFEEFPAMIWRSRHDASRDYFNKTWTTFTGREAAEEKNDAWNARIHPDDRERYLALYAESHRERRAFEIEYRHRRHDDKYRWLADHGMPFKGLDGRFSGFIGFSLDVTDRKKIDSDLRHSLDLLFSIIENIPNMIFLKEANELRFELFNKAGEDLIGFKREEMIGKNDYDFFPKEQADFFTKNDYEVLREKKLIDIPEETIQTRSKGERILHTKKVPIVSDDRNRPAYLLGISEDITDRKKSEEALRESEGRLRAILDHSTAVIYLKDPEGRYLFVNRQFEALFRLGREALTGKTDFDVFPKKFAEAFRANDLKVLAKGGPHEFEEIVEQAGKTHTYISVKFPLLNSEGKPYALCGISTDITERKSSEELLRKANSELTANEKKLRKALAEVASAHEELQSAQSQLIRAEKFAALGKLAGIVSHEFRNQLGVIRNAAFFIKMKLVSPDEKISRHLRILEEEIAETDRIIENILSFARRNRPELHKTDVPRLLEASLAKADIPAEIEVIRDIPAGIGPIDADEVLLGRVFLNIVLNAAQAIKGPGRISIRASVLDRALEIRFEDTGSGIEEKDLQRMFDPLFSTKTHGTGLGLATSKVLVEAHGGTIELLSKAGQGTTVILRLPTGGAG